MNKNEIKVSSITYVKNGEKYIRQCVESVMHQTLKDIEIIVVDGGSTDSTMEILKKLSTEDERIQIIEVEGSVGAQFNVALKAAKGEYIAVVEGDDFITNNKYEVQYEAAHNNRLDVIRSNYYLHYECKNTNYTYEVKVMPPELMSLVIENNTGNKFFVSSFVNGYWNGLYRREFLLDNDIWQNETPGASFQDITFSFLTQLYARRFMFTNDIAHYYRIDNMEASVNSKNSISKLSKEYDLLQDELKKRGLWEQYKDVYLVWEIGSYKQFLDKFEQSEKEAITNEIYERLISQNIPKSYKGFSIYPKTKKIVDGLYLGKDAFFYEMTSCDKDRNRSFEFFNGEEYEKANKIILFGIGHFGQIIYDYLSFSGKEIQIVDNSLTLQQKGYKDQKVYSVDYCLESDDYIVIANIEHAKEMFLQLCDMGIDESRIILCEYEDLFIREIFMKSKYIN